MLTRSGSLAGGIWIVDQLKILEAWPSQDALTSVVGQPSGNGGSACNILKDLACSGAAFSLFDIGLLGDDETGRSIFAEAPPASARCANAGNLPRPWGFADSRFDHVQVAPRCFFSPPSSTHPL